MFTNPIVTSGAFEGQLELPKQLFRLVAMEGSESPTYRNADTYMNIIDLPANQSKVEDFLYSPMGTLPQIDDVETTHLPGAMGFKVSPTAFYVLLDFGMSFVYTEKAAKNDQYGLIAATVRSMASGAEDTIQNYAATRLNRGALDNGGWDKVPMYSATHKYLNDSLYSNILPGAGATPFSLQAIYEWLSMGIRNDAYQLFAASILNLQVHPVALPAWLKQVTAITEVGQNNPNVPNVYIKPIISGVGSLITPDKLVPNGRLTNSYDTHLTAEGHHRNMFFGQRPTPEDPYIVREPSPAMVIKMRASMVAGWTDARRLAFQSGIGAA